MSSIQSANILESGQNDQEDNAVELDEVDEETFIVHYTQLTGASQTQAGNVYMYSDFIRQLGTDGYHLE